MVGLVLAGGGVKGSYQIGAYLALKKCHIKINGIVGTSIGSFNAAMIASGKEKELYEFWKNANIGELLNFNEKYTSSVNNKEKFKEFIYGLAEITSIIKNKGIDSSNIKNTLSKMIDEERLFNSKIDYGLVTVRLNDLKPLYLFKDDMIKGKVADYILASCNLPFFKSSKLIDDKYYVDGGFFDNNPINMLLNKGYDKIYSIEIQGIGFKQKVKTDKEIINISPSRNLGSMLSVDKSKINNNIKLGYYDTLKIIKKYDGYNFIFKKHTNLLYNILAKKGDKELYKKCKKYFQAYDNKELIIKSLEYIMKKEDISYFEIYNVLKIIRRIKKNYNKNNFVYDFIKSI